jgi:hypothetical protein
MADSNNNSINNNKMQEKIKTNLLKSKLTWFYSL